LSQELKIAVISGFFAVLAAVLSALVTKYGVSLWRRSTSIRFNGNGIDLYALGKDGKRAGHFAPFSYILSDGKLRLRGNHASVSAHIRVQQADITDSDKQIVAEGAFKASGTIQSGVAYLRYRVDDNRYGQAWEGVMLLQVPGIGDIVGYWLTQDHLLPGTVFGSTRFQRI
jgi:hypothetical protein